MGHSELNTDLHSQENEHTLDNVHLQGNMAYGAHLGRASLFKKKPTLWEQILLCYVQVRTDNAAKEWPV